MKKPPANKQTVLKRIENNYESLTYSEKRIAQWLGRDVTKLAFLTLHEVAERSGVSEATIIRFARKLEYDNYPDLQKSTQQELQQFSLEMKLTETRPLFENESVLAKLYQIEMNNLSKTYESLSEENVLACAEAIVKARKIAVVGFRASYGVAAYLGFALNLIRGDVTHLELSVDNLNEQMLDYSEKDLCIAFSLQRPARKTIEIVKAAKIHRNMPIIGITDSLFSPIHELSDFVLVGESEGLFNSYTAITSLCHLLVQLSANLLRDSAESRLRTLDKLNAHDVYLK